MSLSNSRLLIESKYEVGDRVRHNVKTHWVGVVVDHDKEGWCLVDWDNDSEPARRAINIARHA